MANFADSRSDEISAGTPIPLRALFPVKEARQLWGGMAHSTFYKLVKERRVRLVRIGRRVYVPAEEIERIARGGVE